MKPTVLIATTTRWLPTARLGMALASAGCTVDTVCPSRHPIRLTKAVRRIYPYNGLVPMDSFAAAIASAKPDLIIPGDDAAIVHLHGLYDSEQRRGEAGIATCALIERSLGAPSSYRYARTRTGLMNLAQEEGVRVPATRTIKSVSELRTCAKQIGFPMVLKSDGTSGGEGVRIARTIEEAEHAFRTLQAPPLLARAIKRALIDRNMTLVLPSLRRIRNVVNAQAFVVGHEATSTVACWEGTVLASLHFEVINKHNSTGPSTVLRLIENDDMSTAAERIVRRLGLSGVVGFDFMLEERTRDTYLVEMNPRPTQVGHLALGPGRDLAAALCAVLSGTPIHESPKVTENDTVTLFPHEWLRSPESPFMRSGYHDVPWEESEFIRACVGTQRKQKALYAQRKQAPSLSPVEGPSPMNVVRR
jgi:formate-dependent phosphoribosylglycinamide formyltransferase (GAR transformylase)